ncbi:MAG: hypothetical protein JXB62_01895 [Pirellulales bacterium]|nr:hypothetical protein [Pirellulales bacterium]
MAMRARSRYLGTVAAVTSVALFVSMIQAAQITWIGGNVNWVNGSSPLNWTPADEPDADDEAIFNTPNSVNLGSDNSVGALTLTGGISLNLAGHLLDVDGIAQLSGSGTDLIVGDTSATFLAEEINVHSGATLLVDDGTVTVAAARGDGLLDIQSGGFLRGCGVINLNDAVAPNTVLMRVSGELAVTGTGFSIPGNPTPGTLRIEVADDADALIDLDGLTSTLIEVFRNQTLIINAKLSDAFSANLSLFHNSTIDIRDPWTLDTGTIIVDNGFIPEQTFPLFIPAVRADVSYIAGGGLTQSGGLIEVADSDGTLQFDTPFTMTGGNFVNRGLVIFNASATIGAGANFTLPASSSSLAVGNGVTVNINQANFNADGSGQTSNVITIGSAGLLDLNLGSGADEGLSGRVELNGGELDVTTADGAWALDGVGSVVVGANTGTSRIDGDAVTITNPVSVGENATLFFNTTSTWNAGGSATIASGGTLETNSPVTFNTTGSFTGAGTLRVDSTSAVTADTTIDVGTFDWDGTFSGATHTISDGRSLHITASNFDSDDDMDDAVELGGDGARLFVSRPTSWTMAGDLTTNTVASGEAEISGSSRLVLAGNMNVAGDTVISAPVTFNSVGTVNQVNVASGATLRVNSSGVRYQDGDIRGDGVYRPGSTNIVEAPSASPSTTRIATSLFPIDQGAWVIEQEGRLDVEVDGFNSTGDFQVDSAMTINGGWLHVDTPAGVPLVMDDTLTMNGDAANPARISSGYYVQIGDDSGVGDARLRVGGDGESRISNADFRSDADVVISDGATLVLSTYAFFFTDANGDDVPDARISGDGSLFVEALTAYFAEATLIDMPNGSVDLDGEGAGATPYGNDISMRAPVVVNTQYLDPFGDSHFYRPDRILVDNNGDSDSLTINLTDPTEAWTLANIGGFNPGVLELANSGPTATLLAGSPVNAEGVIDVSGDVRVEAILRVGGEVDIASGGVLRLGGGDQGYLSANTLEGGSIAGAGILSVDSSKALFGHGIVDVDIVGDNPLTGSWIAATDGMLTINGAISNVGTLGTLTPNGVDAVLNITTPWNTGAVALGALLMGGELTGALVVNDNRIKGTGLVTAQVVNKGRLESGNHGMLIFDNPANDWDGANDDGRLVVSEYSTLELRDNSPVSFRGDIDIERQGILLVNGFALTLEPESTLSLTDGALLYSNLGHAVELGGAVEILAGTRGQRSGINAQTSTITFKSTSTTTLEADLLPNASTTYIEPGASFSGTGRLNNYLTRELSLANAANVGVEILNEGQLTIAGPDAGQAVAAVLEQTTDGEFHVDLLGQGVGEFDQLDISGEAVIDGGLFVSVDNAFLPTLGDAFTILTADGGVSGAFASTSLPTLANGLGLNVSYHATSVDLLVTSNLAGDYNNDGTVDGADFLKWQRGESPKPLSASDLADWQANFGLGSATLSSAVAVPEPAAVALVLIGLLGVAAYRMR